MNFCFSVLVTRTDRGRLPNGRFNEITSHVDVLAPNHHEACLLAAQIVASRYPDHMVIGTHIMEVVG